MKSRGCLSFVFDDGYSSVFVDIVPMLQRYGFPAVFAVPIQKEALEQESGLPVTPWQEWRALSAQGFEIAAHSLTHTNLARLSALQLTTELMQPQQLLEATTLVYPGGAYSNEVVSEAAKYYSAARTVEKGFEQLPPRDPMRLHTYNFTRNNFSVFRANALATLAWLRNMWLIETFHYVGEPGTAYTHAITQHQLHTHLSFVKKLPLAVRTIRQVITT